MFSAFMSLDVITCIYEFSFVKYLLCSVYIILINSSYSYFSYPLLVPITKFGRSCPF